VAPFWAFDVAVWHKCEVPTELSKVRYQGQFGRHLLEPIACQFDPTETSEEIYREVAPGLHDEFHFVTELKLK
jgi:hypothetical protein